MAPVESEEHSLEKRYYTPALAGSLGSVQRLAQAARVPVGNVRKWVAYEDPYTLHAPRRLTFPRNQMHAPTLNDTFQVDLCDMQTLAKHNAGYRYVLTMIDCFSRFLWAIPLKSKSGPVVAAALQARFAKGPVPLKLNSDKGTEFTNQHVQNVLKKFKIRFYTTDSETKASMVERVNRTLKNRLWRYFTKTGTYHYVRALPSIVKGYNHTVHRVIKMPPAQVTLHNESQVWKTLYGKQPLKKKPKYQPGDLVRISNPKKVFEKGYKGLWSHEVFVIDRVLLRQPVVYRIKDRSNEPIGGIFYEPELQRVLEKSLPEGAFAVERILARRKRKGIDYLKVKWLHYTEPSWIPASDLL